MTNFTVKPACQKRENMLRSCTVKPVGGNDCDLLVNVLGARCKLIMNLYRFFS